MRHFHIDENLLPALEDRRQEEFLARLTAHLARACHRCAEALGTGSASQDVAHFGEADLTVLLQEDEDPLAFRLLLHAAAVCRGCAEALGDLPSLYESGALSADFRISELEIYLARSRRDAPALAAELAGYSAAKARKEARRRDRYKSWGLVEYLCAESLRRVSGEPEAALHLAELAVAIVPGVRSSCLPADCLQELRMLAHACYGNALRVEGDLNCAVRAFARAETLWRRVVTDEFPFRAQVLRLRASLEMDRRQFPEALETLAMALELNRHGSAPSAELEAAVQIKRGSVLTYSGQEEQALAAAERAIRLVAPLEPCRLGFIARHNQLDSLTHLGRYTEVEALLPELDRLSRTFGSESDRLKVAWCRARLLQGTGRSAEAVAVFLGLRGRFLAAAYGYRAALVSLELATIYFQQGKLEHVRRLAMEMLPVFQAQDIHREALAALAIFRQASVTEQVTDHLLNRLVSYFHKAQVNPDLRFSASN